jgi:hypothetical protein
VGLGGVSTVVSAAHAAWQRATMPDERAGRTVARNLDRLFPPGAGPSRRQSGKDAAASRAGAENTRRPAAAAQQREIRRGSIAIMARPHTARIGM